MGWGGGSGWSTDVALLLTADREQNIAGTWHVAGNGYFSPCRICDVSAYMCDVIFGCVVSFIRLKTAALQTGVGEGGVAWGMHTHTHRVTVLTHPHTSSGCGV